MPSGAPRLDRLSVSFASPTSNQPSCASQLVTVKQTPLTAIESPSLQSPRTSPALPMRKLKPSNSVVGEMAVMTPSVCRGESQPVRPILLLGSSHGWRCAPRRGR